jgi:uncharacterized protein
MRSTVNLILTLGFLVTIPLLLSTLFANAQSFSCAKAQFSAEFAICNNEVLLTLDEKLAAIYYHRKSIVGTTPQRQQIARDQNAWVEKRNRCDLDWTCLEISYKERIQRLNLDL